MLLIQVMRRVIRLGTVALIGQSGKHKQISRFGKPEVVLRLTDDSIAKRLMFATSTGWGEAYMDGKLLIEEGTLNGFLEASGNLKRSFQKVGLGKFFVSFTVLRLPWNITTRCGCHVEMSHITTIYPPNCTICFSIRIDSTPVPIIRRAMRISKPRNF